MGPPRDTAPQTYLRPPDAASRAARWLLVTCVALLGVAVLLLLLAPLLGPNSTLAGPFANLFGTRVSVQTGVVPTVAAPANAEATPATYLAVLPGYQLWLNDDFNAPSALTQQQAEPGQVASSVLVDRGVYRMQTPSGQLGWTLFDLAQTTSYHLETSAAVDAAFPGGAAGVIARFRGTGNFYLLSVDGSGASTVQLWLDGTPYTVQSSTAVTYGAGQPNRLAVEDDGQRLRFYANQVLVAEVVEPQLPFGRPGIAVIAAGLQDAVVDYDWIAIYRPQG